MSEATDDRRASRASRPRARTWLAENMPRGRRQVGGRHRAAMRTDEEELAQIARCRELQRTLFDGGFAGICVPRGLWRPGPDGRLTKRRSTGRSGATTTRRRRRSRRSLLACR